MLCNGLIKVLMFSCIDSLIVLVIKPVHFTLSKYVVFSRSVQNGGYRLSQSIRSIWLAALVGFSRFAGFLG